MTHFQRRFHDWTVASVTFGEVFTIGLIAPTKRPVQLVLHHVVCFRASDLIEDNIVEAASFEPLPELGLTGLRSAFRRFGHPADTEDRAELLFAKYGGYGALSIDAVMGLNAFALCERLGVLDPSGGRS